MQVLANHPLSRRSPFGTCSDKNKKKMLEIIQNTSPRRNQALVAVLKCHCSHAPSLKRTAAQLQQKRTGNQKKKKEKETKRVSQKFTSALETHRRLNLHLHPCKYSQEGKPVTRTHPKEVRVKN
jgi:hypothetical protein